MRSIVSEVFTSAFGSPKSTKRQGHVLSTKSGGWSGPRARTVCGLAIRSTQVIILISCVVIHLITWELLAIS
jgi:hypothetical protein